jgi:hypothetical protein
MEFSFGKSFNNFKINLLLSTDIPNLLSDIRCLFNAPLFSADEETVGQKKVASHLKV